MYCSNNSSLCYEKLSGHVVDSFAYDSLKDRLPTIICKCIDTLHRNIDSKTIRNLFQYYKEDETAEGQLTHHSTINSIISQLSKLRYELTTNKCMPPLLEEDGDDVVDCKVWNSYADQFPADSRKWFDVPWLYAECYAYRLIKSAFLKYSTHDDSLSTFDYFIFCKSDAFFNSFKCIENVLSSFKVSLESLHDGYEDKLKAILRSLLKLSLWSNKNDLSLNVSGSTAISDLSDGNSNDTESTSNFENLSDICDLDDFLVHDQSEDIIKVLFDDIKSSKNDQVVDFILDNAGLELISDFCLADFLISQRFVGKIHFHVKNIPWFVSDVVESDITWTLHALLKTRTDSSSCQEMCERWKGFIDSGVWEIHSHPFFTYPHPYCEMNKIVDDRCEELLKCLGESSLVIFKGDLNYRKLISDMRWPPITPLVVAVQDLNLSITSPIVVLRTLKSDVICGLSDGKFEKMFEKDPDWMTSGRWGVIQFMS